METLVRTETVRPHTDRAAWKDLEDHFQKVRGLHLRELFADDAERGTRLTAEAVGVYLGTIKLLLQLAEESGLRRAA